MFPRYQSRQIKPRFEWHPKMDPNHPLSVGCIGLWLLNETGGLSAYDLSGNNNHGTLTNGPTWTPGRSGQALKFDGVDDYVNIVDSAQILAPDALTFAAWVKILSGWNATDRIASKKGSLTWDATSGWSLETTSTAEMRFLGSGSQFGDGLSINWTVDEWFYLVTTKEAAATQVKGYKNGSYVDDQTCDTIAQNTQPLTLASFFTQGNNIPIVLDDVRLYNRALSMQEIQWLYQFPYDNLIVEPLRKFWFMPEVAAGGLSIPVAMANYRQRRI